MKFLNWAELEGCEVVSWIQDLNWTFSFEKSKNFDIVELSTELLKPLMKSWNTV